VGTEGGGESGGSRGVAYGLGVNPVGLGGIEDVVVAEFFKEEFDRLPGSGIGMELEELADVGSGEVGGPVVGFGLGGDEPVEAELVALADALEHHGGFGDFW